MKNKIKEIIIIRENIDTLPQVFKINGVIRFILKTFIVIIFIWTVILILGWSYIIQRVVFYEEIKVKNDSLVLHSRQIDTLRISIAKANRLFEYFKMISSFDGKNDLPAINNYMKDTVTISQKPIAVVQKEFKEIPQIRPVTGVISKTFSKSEHEGIDFVSALRSPIRATADGIVKKVYFSDDLGNVVILKHSNDYESLYAHCQEIIVKEGENVVQGETIAFVGNSGNSKGAHLHYEVRKNDKTIDPEQLFL
ncbi:MAG: M23 family metallopeptidase [Chitinispirillales bacterium]|jgi:murein DD-endopeptidase MepM/ murein hydrolase activator NlpD|nr:M23 family metallopeptidase [Chitinispirillales bacterium]